MDAGMAMMTLRVFTQCKTDESEIQRHLLPVHDLVLAGKGWRAGGSQADTLGSLEDSLYVGAGEDAHRHAIRALPACVDGGLPVIRGGEQDAAGLEDARHLGEPRSGIYAVFDHAQTGDGIETGRWILRACDVAVLVENRALAHRLVEHQVDSVQPAISVQEQPGKND